jgi:LDH2 family malate/lactate/ureidoglycolate dehydrogenase
MKNPNPQVSNDLLSDELLRHSRWVHEVACRDCRICTQEGRVLPPDLEDFTARVLIAHKVPEAEAFSVARVLVAADERGIPSHGVARLSRYLKGIQEGTIRPGVEMPVHEPAPAMGWVDARNGLGQVAGEIGMNLAIRKAREHGVGIVTVRNSNHYGIAGYYALMAVEAGLMGMSLTNSAPLVVPTFGVDVMLGTNPISLGAPTAAPPAFLLDMATSVVPRGKLEVYDRNLKQMPTGWAVDEKGYDCENPGRVLRNLMERRGGGILPLGGRGEEYSGHKGYGLAFMVDILCGVLSGAAFGPAVDDIYGKPEAGKTAFPNVGHFFLAIDIARFMPREEFETRLGDLIESLKSSRKAFGQETIYVHGEKEYARTMVHRDVGIPVAEGVFNALTKIAAAAEVEMPPIQPPLDGCLFYGALPGEAGAC